MVEFPTLQTQRLTLREFCAADTQAVFDIFSRDSVTKFYNLETMNSRTQASELVQRRIDVYYKGSGIRWGIVYGEHDNAKIIGSCGYANINKYDRSADIGYDLHPEYWNQGIMTEALTNIIHFGYSDAFFFPLNRIEALTYVEHEVSVHLLLKLGFQEEGIRREYGYFKGAFYNLRCFSLLRRDWFAKMVNEE